MLLSFLKKLFKNYYHLSKQEMIKLGISPTLLEQALQDNDKAQLEIAGRFFATKDEKLLIKAIYWFQK